MNNEIQQNFLQFESDEKLFERQYRGTYYWQALRSNIIERLGKKNDVKDNIENVNHKQSIRGWFAEKISLFGDIISDRKNWNRLNRADILYFDQQSYSVIQGEEVDPFFDFFSFEQKYSVQRCFYYNRGKIKDYMGRGVGTLYAEMKIIFLSRVSRFIPLFYSGGEDDFICRLWQKIDSRFGIDINLEQMLQAVRNTLITHIVYRRYYRKLLRKIKPQVIFVVCHYNRLLWPLYQVSKEFRIPVIEIQHGLINHHRAYNYVDTSIIGKELPDYLFSYGQLWHQWINLPDCMRAYPIGNPFLESRGQFYAENFADSKKIVIYSDRWETNGRILEKLALDISNKYYDQGYRVYFKMHPGEYNNWIEKYVALKENTQIMVVCNEIELYQLLSMAKHQIGVFSTVLYETTVFDVNTYILATEEKYIPYVQVLIDFELAYVIRDFNEFERIMLSGVTLQKEFAEQLWRRNAKQNAQDRLSKIIRKGEGK